jgi:DNA polymerase I
MTLQTKTSEIQNKSIPTSLLVSAAYNKEKNVAVLKFYNPESKEELDLADINREEIVKIEQVKKRDLLNDSEIEVLKISVTNPLAIGGTDSSLRNRIDTWESDIKYYENYLYDKSLIIGKYYKIEEGKIIPQNKEISDEVRLALKTLLWDKAVDNVMVDSKQFQEYVSDWADLLNQPGRPS